MVSISRRSCGSCNMCCEVFRIEDLDKAQGVRCEHLRTGCNGCTIYEQRPDQCRAFACLWVQGVGPASMRPDRSGVVLTSPVDSVPMVHAHASSFEKVQTKTRRVLDMFTERAVVILIAGDRRKLLGGPRHLVEQILSRVAR